MAETRTGDALTYTVPPLVASFAKRKYSVTVVPQGKQTRQAKQVQFRYLFKKASAVFTRQAGGKIRIETNPKRAQLKPKSKTQFQTLRAKYQETRELTREKLLV